MNIGGDWQQLHDRYYRKLELYTMLWNDPDLASGGAPMDLDKYKCYAAPFGGPLALIRDDSKLVRLEQGGSSQHSNVHVYSSAGRRISSFALKKTLGRLLTLGWTRREHLVAVTDDGTVQMYSQHGALLRELSLGAEITKQGGLAEARVYSTGVIGVTPQYRFIALNLASSDPRPRALADARLEQRPASWTIMEPQHTLSNSVEILVATQTCTVLVVDSEGVQDQLLSVGPLLSMEVSPDGKFVACFTATGKLWVVSSDFANDISTFDTKSQVAPEQVAWCGTDCVMLYWDRVLLAVGPGGEWIKYSYDERLHMVTEVDGVRIVSTDACEFFQRVPDSIEAIFSIGSTTPAAMLFEAAECFSNGSPKADEILRAIRAELGEAVEACVSAACGETTVGTQRALLRAASFGKSFLDFFDSDKFVSTCRTLRVLNQTRHFDIGLPLTHAQYVAMGGERVLVERLMDRHQHLLAFRICEYLKRRADDVLVHWACAKVRTRASDREVHDAIVERLGTTPGISFAEVASTAHRCGRPELATMLLEHEPRAADQVPLLISMGQQDELALAKAIESGDTDLVYLVVLHIKRKRQPADFFQIMREQPTAMSLLILYCRSQDPQLLSDLYYATGRPAESANVRVAEALRASTFDERVRGLQLALEIYKEAASTNKESAFAARATEEQVRLMMLQRQLAADLPSVDFDGLSLNDTLYELLKAGKYTVEAKLAKEFKVSEKTRWFIRVRALAERGDWPQLEKVAKEKKSPIGYTPFARACIANKANQEANKYIARVNDLRERFDLFMSINAFKEAANTAAHDAKDPQWLLEVRQRCANDRGALIHVDGLLTQFQQK